MLRAPFMRAIGRRGLATSTTAAATESAMHRDNEFLVRTYARQKVVFSRGAGVHLFDTSGRMYLDFYSGIAVTSLGHGDPALTAALADQAGRLIHVSNLFYNDTAGRLAEQLVRHSFAKRVFFSNSGTEAIEGAMKFARKWGHEKDPSGKKINFVAFHGAFHGRTMGALSCTANPKYRKPFLPLVPGVTHAPLNDIGAVRSLINDETCAVILEPIQGEGGVNAAQNEFLQELRLLCDKHEALLVFDEVQSGMGRTGKLWAHEWTGVTPDVMALAKALGNGMPIGAILVSQRVGDVIVPGDHGSTFAAQPLACRAGEVVFERISQPAFLEHVSTMGNLLRDSLLALNNPNIKQVRGRGLIVGVVVDIKRMGLNDVTPILDRARDMGLVIINAGSDVLRLLPPLIIQKEHVHQAVDIINRALQT